MKKTILFSIFLLLFLTLSFVIVNYYPSNSIHSRQKTFLEDKGNFCLGVAEKSVANRQAIVEFQKFEILGDKAIVMRRCMEENGFEENPLWLKENVNLIHNQPRNSEISEDEAIENLKRESIYIFYAEDKKPLYWQLKNK